MAEPNQLDLLKMVTKAVHEIQKHTFPTNVRFRYWCSVDACVVYLVSESDIKEWYDPLYETSTNDRISSWLPQRTIIISDNVKEREKVLEDERKKRQI